MKFILFLCSISLFGQTLLFKSGFEASTTLGAIPGGSTGDAFQLFSGTDASTGYTWPMSFWGANAATTGLHSIVGTGNTVATYATNDIETVIGPQGDSTKALKIGITGGEPPGECCAQVTFQISQPSTSVTDYYVRYWTKFNPEFLAQEIAGGGSFFRTMLEMKTFTDYRIATFVYGQASGTPYWAVVVDNNPEGPGPTCPTNACWTSYNYTVPVSTSQWMLMEYYLHRSAGSDGRFYWAVNGQTIVDHSGPTYGANSENFDFLAFLNVYGTNMNPAYQYLDNIEVWNTPPCATLPCGAGDTSFSTDSNGWVVTGLPANQNNLIGPLIPSGNSPWIYGDLAEQGVAGNQAPAALAEAPVLGAALSGTVSWTQGNNVVSTTADLRTALSGIQWIALAWNSVDGNGTGRALCNISNVTAAVVNCQSNIFAPTSSGITAYIMNSTPDSHGWTFLSWTAGAPSVSWNYYDNGIAYDRIYYRTGQMLYQTWGRIFADIQWQWVLDHGYNPVYPRAASMISQFFRALDGHSERLPGLYNWIALEYPIWVPTYCPYCDNREVGYRSWDAVLGAKIDTDPTRHAQYCSWVSSDATSWNSVQYADGSFGENEYANNNSYVSAPKAYTLPILYQGAPWREAINVKELEAAYESLADTTSQGCNNPTLAAATFTTITNAVTWQWNYGRDTSNRGTFYEVNSQSADQNSVSPATGTASAVLTSTAITGSGTNWKTAGYCDGTHFIGISSTSSPTTNGSVYKIASCADDTHAVLSVAFGFFGETGNVTNSSIGFAPASYTGCNSVATYCFGPTGDRNLERTVAGGVGWLYAHTLNPTYLAWTNELLSAQLGGPTAGLTTAANIGAVTLPCSGPACDGLVTDTVASAASCYTQAPPCVYGSYLYSNLGKNFGEAFGAPGIDNALAWRLLPQPTAGGTIIGGKGSIGGHSKH